MKKTTTFILIMLIITSISNAQTIEKKWGFGAGAGGYHNSNTKTIGLNPGAYLSRYLNPSFDIMANVSFGYFGNKNADEIDMVNPALNLRYKFNNGYIMPVESTLLPYIYAGAGYMFDNAKSDPNFKFGGGVKYPFTPTFSIFAEAGYNHGIYSITNRNIDGGVSTEVHDNFTKLIVGIEIAFIKQPDTDKDGVIDPIDKCPDTPKGATVDELGCPSDTDNDGVLDGIDKCPNTDPGVEVDEKGCALDADGDGVPDSKDECPDTPKRTKVDEKGCPFDEDGDGVFDENDKCPGTEAGVEVDKRGCPIDSDGDGVADKIDKCPDTPKGEDVDANGCTLDDDRDGVSNKEDKCPATRLGARVDKNGCINHKVNIDFLNEKLYPIYFDTDIDKVTTVQNNKIDNIIKILNEYPEYKVNLYGHADPRGTDAYNKALSQRRVDDVVELLKAKGITSDRMTTKAYGEELSRDIEMTDEEMQENRKVASYMYIVISE